MMTFYFSWKLESIFYLHQTLHCVHSVTQQFFSALLPTYSNNLTSTLSYKQMYIAIQIIYYNFLRTWFDIKKGIILIDFCWSFFFKFIIWHMNCDVLVLLYFEIDDNIILWINSKFNLHLVYCLEILYTWVCSSWEKLYLFLLKFWKWTSGNSHKKHLYAMWDLHIIEVSWSRGAKIYIKGHMKATVG